MSKLVSDERANRVIIWNGLVGMLLEYADMMEAGEVPMRSGPDALRDMAVNVAAEVRRRP